MRLSVKWYSGVGPSFVAISVGLRLVLGTDPMTGVFSHALHVGLWFGELSLYLTGKPPKEGA